MRSHAKSKYFLSISTPTNLRPSLIAAMPVEPMPIKGSRTVSPSFENSSTSSRISESGFRSEERRVGKECRSRCDWSSDVCSSDLDRRNAGGADAHKRIENRVALVREQLDQLSHQRERLFGWMQSGTVGRLARVSENISSAAAIP